MVNIDSKLLEALKASSCFGIAHDESVPECKQCDVKGQCKAKSEGVDITKPVKVAKTTPVVESTTVVSGSPAKKTSEKKGTSTKTSTKSATAKTKAKTSSTPTLPSDMPDFKSMSLEELKALSAERQVEWRDYNNDSITRMRLIMSLKKSYQ